MGVPKGDPQRVTPSWVHQGCSRKVSNKAVIPGGFHQRRSLEGVLHGGSPSRVRHGAPKRGLPISKGGHPREVRQRGSDKGFDHVGSAKGDRQRGSAKGDRPKVMQRGVQQGCSTRRSQKVGPQVWSPKGVPQRGSTKGCWPWGVGEGGSGNVGQPSGIGEGGIPMGVPEGYTKVCPPSVLKPWSQKRFRQAGSPNVGFPRGSKKVIHQQLPPRVVRKMGRPEGVQICSRKRSPPRRVPQW
jgi:hypothetical protein